MATYFVSADTIQAATFATLGASDWFVSAAGTTLLVTDESALWATEGARLTINGSVLGGGTYVIEGPIDLSIDPVTISIGRDGLVEGGEAITISGGRFWSISNAGVISGTSAIALQGDSAVVNTGEIRGLTTSASGSLVMDLGHDSSLINHGLINGAFGVSLDVGGYVVNTGTITSERGWGLLVAVGTVVNSGLIHSFEGIGVALQVGGNRLENSGTIGGGLAAVYGDGDAESILNTGTLAGPVLLLGGDDYVDGRLGIQIGLVDGGEGDDVLLLGSADEEAYGDYGYDTIRGGAGDDTIEGGPDPDELDGGAGRDLLDYCSCGGGVSVSLEDGLGGRGDAAGDTISGFEDVSGTAYADSIVGDDGGNMLDGRGGHDEIEGGDGRDTLRGGAGRDTVTGGAGGDAMYGGWGDVFRYEELTDSAPRGAGRDRIVNFITPDRALTYDTIDLSALDADVGTDGDQDFTFVGAAAFSAAGQLRADLLPNGNTLVQAEVDGDGRADFAIVLVRVQSALTSDSFAL
jgi:Ca2+-binding RTX toxin-like protein